MPRTALPLAAILLLAATLVTGCASQIQPNKAPDLGGYLLAPRSREVPAPR